MWQLAVCFALVVWIYLCMMMVKKNPNYDCNTSYV
jgi:hypothetical protein